MDILLGLLLGIGLSAACGFKVFVPLLVISISSLAGHLEVTAGFKWIISYPALITFSIATLLEITAYFIPVVDNLLEKIATPAAIIAGSIITASFIGEISPFLKWCLAIIAGGGASSAIQLTTGAIKRTTTTSTNNRKNNLIFATELTASLFISITTIFLPYITILIIPILFYLIINRLFPQLLTEELSTERN